MSDEIKKYFLEEKWEQLSEDEFNGYLKSYRRFKYLECLNDNVQMPDFMKYSEAVDLVTPTDNKVRKSLRKKKKVQYVEEEEEEAVFYCEECKSSFIRFCVACGMVIHVLDNDVPMGVDRAHLTAPNKLIEIKPSKIQGMGAFAVNVLPQNTKFGPYEGVSSKISTHSTYEWLTSSKTFIDSFDVQKSNWMRYVNCSRNAFEQNLHVVEMGDQIYYLVLRKIEIGEELLVYYGDEYAMVLNIDVQNYKNESEIFCKNKFHKDVPKKNTTTQYSTEETFLCDICGFAFGSKLFWNKHITFCKGSTVKMYKRKKRNCNICDFSTFYPTTLKYHKLKHLKSKNFKCEICDAAYGRKYHLNRHKNSKHKLDKNFKCDQCDYASAQKALLESHIMKHMAARKLICPICKKGFNSKLQLENHDLQHNGKEKKYQCQNCSYKTYLKTNLVRHMFVHSKVNMYYCYGCPYKTVYIHNLRRHIKLMHDKNDQKKGNKEA